MKFGIIVFPGSNCDHDAYHVISKHVGQPVDFIWHRDTDLRLLRRGDHSRWIFIWRLSARRRPGAFFTGDGIGKEVCRHAAASSWVFAMAFKFFAKPDCCPAH